MRGNFFRKTFFPENFPPKNCPGYVPELLILSQHFASFVIVLFFFDFKKNFRDIFDKLIFLEKLLNKKGSFQYSLLLFHKNWDCQLNLKKQIRWNLAGIHKIYTIEYFVCLVRMFRNSFGILSDCINYNINKYSK